MQSLVRFHAEGSRRLGGGLTPEALAEDRFLAARDGMAAEFVGGFRGRRPQAAERLAGVLAACAPVAGALGCLAELEERGGAGREPGHAWQRATVAASGLDALVPSLSADVRRAPHARLSATWRAPSPWPCDQARAFAFSFSNSPWSMVPLSSSCFARSISPAEPAEPPSFATVRT